MYNPAYTYKFQLKTTQDLTKNGNFKKMVWENDFEKKEMLSWIEWCKN